MKQIFILQEPPPKLRYILFFSPQSRDYLLYIYENDEKQKGFTFEFELNQSGIGDFATYQDDSHQQATCILSHQKDCQLTFTFGKDYVIAVSYTHLYGSINS